MKYIVKKICISTYDNHAFPNEMHVYYFGSDEYPHYHIEDAIPWETREEAEAMIEDDRSGLVKRVENGRQYHWAEYHEVMEMEEENE